MAAGRAMRTAGPFQAGGLVFVVECATSAMKAVVDSLFRDLPQLDTATIPVQRFTVREAAEPGRWDVAGPVIGGSTGLTPASGVTRLVTGVNLAALAAEPDRLHLHAAGAVRGGQALILSAPRETGKTTMLTQLVLRGWQFISDEAVSLGRGDSMVRGFAKPLSIKPSGRHLVPQLEDHVVPPVSQAAEDEVVHVALGAVGGRSCSAALPRLVAVLVRPLDATSAASSRRLHPVDAVVRLMGETMDAGRFGREAVVELAQLAARSRCYEVTVGTPDSTATEIERIFTAGDPLTLVPEVLEDGRYLSPGLVTVQIGDRVVIHEQPEGRILALDEIATQIWLALGDWPREQHVDLNGPGVETFVERLRALGLVRGGSR